jgi:hypothetical protein
VRGKGYVANKSEFYTALTISLNTTTSAKTPLEMIVDTHISVEEGEAMGIPAKSTRSYRRLMICLLTVKKLQLRSTG